MIQRIQTLYMFLGFATAVVLFFLPLVGFNLQGEEAVEYQLLTFESIRPLGISMQSLLMPVIMNTAVALLLLINIFLYKSRKIQKRLLLMAMVLNLATLGGSFFVADQITSLKEVTSEASYKLGIYAPLLIMMFIVFANRGIRKDDKLMKSSERLR